MRQSRGSISGDRTFFSPYSLNDVIFHSSCCLWQTVITLKGIPGLLMNKPQTRRPQSYNICSWQIASWWRPWLAAQWIKAFQCKRPSPIIESVWCLCKLSAPIAASPRRRAGPHISPAPFSPVTSNYLVRDKGERNAPYRSIPLHINLAEKHPDEKWKPT